MSVRCAFWLPDPKNMFDHTSTIGGPSVAFAVLGAVAGPTVAAQRRKTYGRRNSTLPNPKKIWEESQMARKVKEHIKNAKILRDEKELIQLSMNCEGTLLTDKQPSNTSTLSLNTAPSPAMRRNTLPNLTESTVAITQTKTTTSVASTQAQAKRMTFPDEPKTKFGAKSPTTLRKLLALSEEGEKRLKKQGKLNIFRPTKSANTSPTSSPTNSPPEVRRQQLRRPPSLQRSHTDTSESGVGSASSSIGSSDAHTTDRVRGHIPGGSTRSSYTSSYDTTSLDSAHSAASYDSRSVSSVGSSSPPVRETRRQLIRARHLSPPPVMNCRPVSSHSSRPPYYHGNKLPLPTPFGSLPPPPDYRTATANLANSPYKSQQPHQQQLLSTSQPQERRLSNPPDYHVATATRTRTAPLENSEELEDYYDEDGEQVSVV
uniref:Rap guanine nucleotide exchange factor 2-like isoform X2 n=1 Tax=Saccoglossus kowalevskii TaxID=10224 RepID=A0ABM0M1Z5_SACKO|nr:PREDICTED: rap guanine nucleotide exchange factor 2-like isoform X2 [Saccoglossus kowalevskii]